MHQPQRNSNVCIRTQWYSEVLSQKKIIDKPSNGLLLIRADLTAQTTSFTNIVTKVFTGPIIASVSAKTATVSAEAVRLYSKAACAPFLNDAPKRSVSHDISPECLHTGPLAMTREAHLKKAKPQSYVY